MGWIIVWVMPDGFQFIGAGVRAEVAGSDIDTGAVIRTPAAYGVNG